MNCFYCECAISHSQMSFEFENENECFYVCGKCYDDFAFNGTKIADGNLIAVWKYGTSVEIDEDDEFDINDYTDAMFCDDEEECYACESDDE